MAMREEQLIYTFRGYRLDPGRRRLSDPSGEQLSVRSKVFETLVFLIERAGEPVSKNELMNAVWPHAVVEENNLNQAISTLRQLFNDDHHHPEFIATITGRGYQWVCAVERTSSADDSEATAYDPESGPVDMAAATARPLHARWPIILTIAAIAVALWLYSQRSAPVAVPTAELNLEHVTLVTDYPGSHSDPTLSPDGTRMAFVSDRSGSPQIWVQSLPHGKPVQITTGEFPASAPSWSPARDEILFQRRVNDGPDSIWLIDALGTSEPRLIVRDGSIAQFAPDGRRIVFQRGQKWLFISEIDRAPSERRIATPDSPGFAAPMPVMNANGDIVFAHAKEGPSGDVWLIDGATGEARALTDGDGAIAGMWARSPTFTPDGGSVVFSATVDSLNNAHLWRVRIDGKGLQQISTGVGDYDHPALSHDGKRLLYTHTRPVSRIMRTDILTGVQIPIYQSHGGIALPLASYDGRRVVFFGAQVQTVGVDGSGLRQWTFAEPGEHTLPTWSATDEAIYLYKNRGLHRLNLSDGQITEVLSEFHWSSRTWLAVHGDRIAYWEFGLAPNANRTIINNLATGEQVVLPEPLHTTQWSRDGTSVLGMRSKDSVIMVCRADASGCDAVKGVDGVVQGLRPRFSRDESRIFYRLPMDEKPGFGEIWSIDRDGANRKKLVEIGPYDPRSVYFSVAEDDSIIWNQFDREGGDEIWMAEVGE